MRYLSPKADLTFKKVFGEHPDLIISFLNALLPFEMPEEEITQVEYLNPEMVPENPLRKNSIVDVRCKDQSGRQFIVEMQMMWTSAYKQRVLFNASKAYVSQLGKGNDYELLQPVYSLNLVNDTFSESKGYYHDFKIVEDAETKEVIEGLRFIFIELPKFTPDNYKGKKMQVLSALPDRNQRTDTRSAGRTDGKPRNQQGCNPIGRIRIQRSPTARLRPFLGYGQYSQDANQQLTKGRTRGRIGRRRKEKSDGYSTPDESRQ